MQQPSETSIGTSGSRESGLQASLPSVSRLLRADVLVLLLIFVVFHYFKLSSFSLAIDDEYEALRPTHYNWIVTGRWAAYLFLRLLAPQPIVPFFPAFLFGLGLALSYPLLLSCFRVKRLQPVHYLTFPLYAGFPTWAFLTSLTTASCWAGAGQLAVVLALHRYRRTLDALDSGPSRNRAALAINALLCIVALAVAIGFYQVFVVAFVALGLGTLLVDLPDSTRPFWSTLKRALWLAALTVLGGALYSMIDAAFRHSFGLLETSYLGGFLHLRALIDAPLSVIKQTVRSIVDVYAGLAPVYGVNSVTFPFIILSGLVAVLFWGGQSAGNGMLRFALAVGILCMPFLLHLLNGGAMPLRTLVAIPSVFWLFAMFGLTSRVRVVAMTALLATVLGLVQILYASNLYYAAGYFTRIHDQELAAAVYARIVELQPDFNSGKIYKVDFFGPHTFQTVYPRPLSSTLSFSFFEWDGGNEERILDYMRLIGYTNLRMASPEQRRQDLAEFDRMPAWPSRDSVRIVGDVTLVKLGTTPGFPFNVP
jgi:Glucosyl transferase GtrII